MDKTGLGLVLVAILGVALVATAPPEPTYSVSVNETSLATVHEITQFSELEPGAQQEFLTALENDEWTGGESPTLENGVVRYEGTLYRVSVNASESYVLSLLQPAVGGGLAILATVGRRLWRRTS